MARRSSLVLLIHGGAGARSSTEQLRQRKQVMLQAVREGSEWLRQGGNALEAAVRAVVAMENSPVFNAGFGSALNRDGEVEMDASVMVGLAQPKAGAVAAVRRVKNPIRLAQAVMELTEHVLMVGAGAERLATEAGVERCRPQDLIAPQARSRWEQFRVQKLSNLSAASSKRAVAGGSALQSEAGTVGAGALDSQGVLVAATSTGGITGKLRGRVGDSAIIGAGTYADPTGAASATGVGEAILKAGLCREAVRMLRRLPPERAAIKALDQMLKMTRSQAGLIVVDRLGRFAYAHNCQTMDVAGYAPDKGVYFFSAPPNYASPR